MAEWNLENAAHLLRRAAFGGTPRDIRNYHRKHGSVESAVDEILRWKPSRKKPRVHRKDSDYEGRRRMQAWWVKMMVAARRPGDAAREKMVLFLHDHLASGTNKQPEIGYMATQNGLFRSFARGSFRNLMREFHRDPANLYYIDGIRNQATSDLETDPPRADANENFAREFMELHTLGIYQLDSTGLPDLSKPNYTESDVHQLARALTGWNEIHRDKGVWNPELPHFDGGRCDDNADGSPDPVTIFGVTNNNFRIDDEVAGTQDDVLEMIFSRRDASNNNQVGMFIASKLWTWYAYPPPDVGLGDVFADLAARFAGSDFSLETLLRGIFTHELFYSDQAKTRSVKNPADYMVQAFKAFGIKTDGQTIGGSGRHLGDRLNRMGMELFEPPSVAGWDGGLGWINSGTLLARLEFARDLARSDKGRKGLLLKAIEGMPLKEENASPEAVLNAILAHLGMDTGPRALSQAEKDELLAFATSEGSTLDLSDDKTPDARRKVRGLVALCMQSPKYMIH